MMQNDSNLGGGSTGGESGGLGSTGSGAGGLGGSGTGGTTGGSLGSTGGSGLSDGALGSEGTGFTEEGVFTTGDDFDAHDGYYKRHYTIRAEPATPPVTTYEDARVGYELGHRAAANPTYANRTFAEAEVDLERDYGDKSRFAAVKGYARHAFEWKKVLGALALAGGAWWVSRKLTEVVSEMGTEEEQDCRTFYDSHPSRTTVPYEQARTVYVIGYAAARNPDYSGRAYDDVEPHLRGGYTSAGAGDYDALRDFTRRGYERGSSRRTS
jgi:hypothetical protein